MVEKFCMEKTLIYLLQVVYAQNRLVNTKASTFSDGYRVPIISRKMGLNSALCMFHFEKSSNVSKIWPKMKSTLLAEMKSTSNNYPKRTNKARG